MNPVAIFDWLARWLVTSVIGLNSAVVMAGLVAAVQVPVTSRFARRG
ncbi:MAG TPA: hypothetical protein PLZ95_06710 [Bryobacteraceae bacterium]|nr:hypothetical protein [Bryobacteraceae bacterium]